MRCAAFSCTANRPLYVPSQDPAFEKSAVGHFHDKLLKIKERLKTKMGKKLGEERHKYVSIVPTYRQQNYDHFFLLIDDLLLKCIRIRIQLLREPISVPDP